MASVVAITGKTVDDATSISNTVSTSSGNLLLAIAGSYDGTTHTLAMSSSGWTKLYANSTANDLGIGLWQRDALTTGDAVSVTISSPVQANVLSLQIIEISGASGVANWNGRITITGGAAYTLETVTTYADGALVLGSIMVRADPAAPSGYAEELDTANAETYVTRLVTFSKTYAAAGATGDVAGTLLGSAYDYTSLHFSLTSGSGGGTDYGDIFRDHAF